MTKKKIPYITNWDQCSKLADDQVYISDQHALGGTKERQWQVARNGDLYLFAETYSLRAAILIARAMMTHPKWKP